MKKIAALVLVACFAVSVLFTGANASRPMIFWGTTFEEYDRFFLMLTAAPGLEYEWFFGEETIWEISEEWLERTGFQPEWLRQGLRSGLYHNTNPPGSIYYVDRYFWEAQLFFTSDGRYFVNLNDVAGAFNSPGLLEELFDMEVLMFYADGVQVASYRMSDMIEDRNLLDDVDFIVPWMGDSIERSQRAGTLVHDQQRGTLSIETIEGRRFTFDITTGEIISGGSLNTNWNPQTGA